MKSVGKLGRLLGIVPTGAWYLLFLILPMIVMARYSLAITRDLQLQYVWTLENYRELIQNPIYRQLLVKSVKLAVSVTALTLALAYPAAWIIATSQERNKELLLTLLIMPWWASYIVRIFAMRLSFGSQGIINAVLQLLPFVDAPFDIFGYNLLAIAITEANLYLPLMIVPIYMTLERMDFTLIDAASSLGARPWRTFLQVIVPLSMPGVLTGTIFVLLPVTGTFIVPLLVGGPSDIMIGNIIVNQFGVSYNWPLGSSLALVLLAILLLTLRVITFGADELAQEGSV